MSLKVVSKLPLDSPPTGGCMLQEKDLHTQINARLGTRTMLKIGDFAKLSRVPVKTLRYYDEIGLLTPSEVDRFTRYRYYSEGQLPMLYRILTLKELGFSLEQIGRLLEDDLSPDQLRQMLELRWK